MPSSFNRSANFGELLPGWLMPARSPLTSAMNTGTPIALRRSANTCSVTVLPVPVAPVIRPWRLASAGNRRESMSRAFAIEQWDRAWEFRRDPGGVSTSRRG